MLDKLLHQDTYYSQLKKLSKQGACAFAVYSGTMARVDAVSKKCSKIPMLVKVLSKPKDIHFLENKKAVEAEIVQLENEKAGLEDRLSCGHNPYLRKALQNLLLKCKNDLLAKEKALVKLTNENAELEREKTHLKNEKTLLHKVQEGNHKNIIKLYEIREDEKFAALVMEMCKGGNLKDRLKKKLTFHEKASITVQIFEALDHIHKCGVIHRDIKPENFVMVSSDRDRDGADYSKIKLIDFGLALPFGETDAFAGTPQYIAPELSRKLKHESDPPSALSDVWAAGVTVYKLWTRRYLWGAETVLKEITEENDAFEGEGQTKFNYIRENKRTLFSDSTEEVTEVIELLSHIFVKVQDRWNAEEILEGPVVAKWKQRFDL